MGAQALRRRDRERQLAAAFSVSTMRRGRRERMDTMSHWRGERGTVLNMEARKGMEMTETCMMQPRRKAPTSFILPKSPTLNRE